MPSRSGILDLNLYRNLHVSTDCLIFYIYCMKSSSLTKQAGFLMAGRILAMPLAFFLPVVLVRFFSIEEFGHYKQLFLIFYTIIPFLDCGLSNSLFYFIPKYPHIKENILSQTCSILILISLLTTICFFIFKNEIALVFSGSLSLSPFVPHIGLFAAFWHISTVLEVVLIVEKKAFHSGMTTFLSDAAKSIAAIIAVLTGGGLKEVLYAFILIGFLRTLIMFFYISTKNIFSFSRWDTQLLRSQLAYALPFGFAVIVIGLVDRSHQYIISISTNASVFAIYSVGCFQLPFLAIVVDSIAKATLVRISELTSEANSSIEIAQIISNSIRKLWILFFPVFVFLFCYADEIITLLFTDNYKDSIPIFRIFIFLIPLSAILVQHVPRAFSETGFILKNNLICLFLTVLFGMLFINYFGIMGPALGFILANLIWKIIHLNKCKKMVNTDLRKLLPFGSMTNVALISIVVGIMITNLKVFLPGSKLISISVSYILYSVIYVALFWKTGILIQNEKQIIIAFLKKISRFLFKNSLPSSKNL